MLPLEPPAVNRLAEVKVPTLIVVGDENVLEVLADIIVPHMLPRMQSRDVIIPPKAKPDRKMRTAAPMVSALQPVSKEERLL